LPDTKPMRCLIFVLFLLTSTRCIAANAIDSLQTDKDVEAFANHVVGKFLGAKHLNARVLPTASIYQNAKCDSVAKQWNGKNWQKADFNSDGKTDLLVILYFDCRSFRSYVITDVGSQGFKAHNLNREFPNDCELAKIVTINQQPALLYYYVKMEATNLPLVYRSHLQIDALIYKYGGFVEYNRNPRHVEIKAIDLETFGSWSESPAFKLNVRRNGHAVYKPTGFATNQKTEAGKITAEKLEEITALLGYINIRQLKDSYAVNWTDDQTVDLKITFADGSAKTIHDYGLKGTFGLSHLYNVLFYLRRSESWK